MLVKLDRPRDLRWYHAGPLLFGDLGTSRLYTLGLAVPLCATVTGALQAQCGGVISGVADNLPAESTLLIHA